MLLDSALPLGSFAFSSGFESYIAYQKPKPFGTAEVERFVALSLGSVASASLPYVLATHEHPEEVARLDDEFDASTLCNITRKASVAQGRALISVWERSLAESVRNSTNDISAIDALRSFGSSLRGSGPSQKPSSHFPPLFGCVCAASTIPKETAAYIYLFKHCQAVMSAAVRSSAVGPYQAQAVLASGWLQNRIQTEIATNWDIDPENASQTVPVLELVQTLHGKLYSRIFQS